MDRTQKKLAVEEVSSILGDIETVIVSHNKGLTVAQITDLRRRVRKSGASMKVVKNRLVKIALKGTKFEALTPLFKGPTSVTYSKDPVAAAKAIVEFSKTNEKLDSIILIKFTSPKKIMIF
jgi:large subunit ribosomal protein L10